MAHGTLRASESADDKLIFEESFCPHGGEYGKIKK
jgi:hypothetical protein